MRQFGSTGANSPGLAENDAAILMPQSQCSVESLADSMQRLFVGGRTTLTTMAVKARQLAKPEATIKVAEYCLEVACV